MAWGLHAIVDEDGSRVVGALSFGREGRAVAKRKLPQDLERSTGASAEIPCPLPVSNSRHIFNASILVVDPDPEFTAWARRVGGEKLIRVVTAEDLKGALDVAQNTRLDGAIISTDFPDWEWRELAQWLRGAGDMALAAIASNDTIEVRLEAVAAQATLFLVKPLNATDFVDAVIHLKAAREMTPSVVLVVADELEILDPVSAILERADNLRVRELPDPRCVLTALKEHKPDLVIAALRMRTLSGTDICRLVRTSPNWGDLGIILVCGDADGAMRGAAAQAGADDLIPISRLDELLDRVNLRIDRRRTQRALAFSDPLTGLLRRNAFSHVVGLRINEMRRRCQTMALCMLDIDHFKDVNDTYGHLVGDRVLAVLGRLLTTRVRDEDACCRWGGEEFAVAMFGESRETAHRSMERLLSEFRAVEFEHDGHTFSVTFSVGVAVLSDTVSHFEHIVRKADDRLYEAKRRGRARVISS